MLRRVSNALFVMAWMTMPLSGQRGGGMPMRSPTPGLRSFHLPGGQPSHPFGGTVFLGTPIWADDFAPSNPSTPSVIVVQAAPAEKPADREEPRAAAPLLIEWQGDRYVRRADVTSATSHPRDYVAEAKSVARTSTHGTPAQSRIELPPTLFVFRDGHREESSDYSIIAGVIYARGQYWTNGYWSKQISLSQLDLPATFKANQERGVAFRLPSAPNEVITRP